MSTLFIITHIHTAKEKKAYGCGWVDPTTAIPSGTPENPTIVKPPTCLTTSIFGKAGQQTFITNIDTAELTKYGIRASDTSPYALPIVGNPATLLPFTHFPAPEKAFWFGYTMPAGVVSKNAYPVEGIIRTEKLNNTLRAEIEKNADTSVSEDAQFAVRFYHRFPSVRGKNIKWQPIFTITTSEDPSSIPIKAYIQNQGRTLHLQQYDSAGNASLTEFIIGTAEQ